MQEQLPARLREIAKTVDDWNAPLCASVDLIEAAKEIERLRNVMLSIAKKSANAMGTDDVYVSADSVETHVDVALSHITRLSRELSFARNEIERMKNVLRAAVRRIQDRGGDTRLLFFLRYDGLARIDYSFLKAKNANQMITYTEAP